MITPQRTLLNSLVLSTKRKRSNLTISFYNNRICKIFNIRHTLQRCLSNHESDRLYTVLGLRRNDL